jgi:hypothetical protein
MLAEQPLLSRIVHRVQVEIMRFQVYLSLEGSHFNPTEFNNSLDEKKVGQVGQRKKISSNAIKLNVREFYWKSKVYEVVDVGYPEDYLLDLIKSLTSEIKALSEKQEVKVSANIVAYSKESDPTRGFYFSSDLVKALALLNAEINIDAVYDLAD